MPSGSQQLLIHNLLCHRLQNNPRLAVILTSVFAAAGLLLEQPASATAEGRVWH